MAKKKLPPEPPVVVPPPDPDIQKILEAVNMILMRVDGVLAAQTHLRMRADGILAAQTHVTKQKAPPPDPNIQKILDIVTADLSLDADNNERLIALAQNIGVLTDVTNTNSRWLSEIDEDLDKIEHQIEEILSILKAQSITDFVLYQVKGDSLMAITGIVVGTTGQFQIGFVPSTNFIPLPQPPTVAADDALVILSPVDLSFQFKAAVDPTDTATTFNVTVSGVNDQGTTVTHTFSIPILPTPPPPPVSVTDFSLDQLS